MTNLDIYDACFCGCGRKLRHCAGRNLLPELEQLLRAIDGDQRVAALEQIRRVEAKRGPHSTLAYLKAQVHIALDHPDEARQAIDELAKLNSNNPNADALSAVWGAIYGDDLSEAAAAAQRCFSALDRVDLGILLHALQVIGLAMADVHNLPAMRLHWLAMGHPVFAGHLSDDQKHCVLQAASEHFPKRIQAADAMLEPDDEADRPERGILASEPSAVLEWISQRTQHPPRDPATRHNLAVLYVRLHQVEKAVQLWSDLANDEQLEDWRRVEANSWKSLYMDVDDEWLSDQLEIQLQVTDIDAVNERFLDDPRFIVSRQAPTEGRRPRSVYGVLESAPAAAARGRGGRRRRRSGRCRSGRWRSDRCRSGRCRSGAGHRRLQVSSHSGRSPAVRPADR